MEKHVRDISCLEPFLEAVPTTYILLAIYYRDYRIFGQLNEYNFLGISKFTMFWITFSISVFSGSFGMAKFLKLGPCRIVPSDKWSLGFFLLFLSIATTLVGKSLVLAFTIGDAKSNDYIMRCINWICLCLLPQLLLAMLVLMTTQGWKNTVNLIWRYPALILIPVFSCWTIGPVSESSTSNLCCGSCKTSDSTVGVSFTFTFVNFLITLSGSLFCYIIANDLISENPFSLIEILTGSLILFCPLFLVSFICILLLNCFTNSKYCGVPVTKMENFDINELHHSDAFSLVVVRCKSFDFVTK